MSSTDPVAQLARDILAAAKLPPAARARRLRDLVAVAAPTLTDAADAATVEALATTTYPALAEVLGVSRGAVNKAVIRHNARAKATAEAGA